MPRPPPPVFPLVPPAVRHDRRLPRDVPVPPLLIFRQQDDGSVTAKGFPDEIDADPDAVAALDTPTVRVERDRLYVEVANGTAVYVPVGPSPLSGCRRYGRLYLREG